MSPRIRVSLLLAAGVVAGLGRPVSAQGTNCPATTGTCAEVTAFVTTVTDFRQSVSGYDKVVSATFRFRNKTSRPLVLGYVQKSGVVTDDQGVRYLAVEPVQGIGMVNSNTFDPKFTLQPGEQSDARIEFVWRPTRGVIYGTTFTLDLSVREIDFVVNNQYRLGREHPLHFSGFGGPPRVATAPAPAAGSPPAPPPPAGSSAPPAASPAAAPAPEPPPPVVDPCERRTRCYGAGPFVAEVTAMTGSRVGQYRDHVIQATVRFRNLTNALLVLGYTPGSSGMVDDQGNRYMWGRGGYDSSVKGMGSVLPNKVDASFVLRPGESRDALFTVWFRPGRAIMGSAYAFNFTVEQLEILQSNQVRSLRQYIVGFQDLKLSGPNATGAAGNAAGNAAASLIDQLAKKIKKPR